VAFPETVGVLDALHEMQGRRAQLAVVVNEHGSVDGIVTMEDLIEELVGEIYDEVDRDVLAVQRNPDGSIDLPGSFPVHDLPDIGVHRVPDGDYATVAGLVLDQLNRLPDHAGDRVEIGTWELEVTAVGRRTITQIRLRAIDADPHTKDVP
jgi:putative hemolysin